MLICPLSTLAYANLIHRCISKVDLTTVVKAIIYGGVSRTWPTVWRFRTNRKLGMTFDRCLARTMMLIGRPELVCFK